jgi:hypothetical protein
MNLVIGIDQTGAVDSLGRAKPLPIAMAWRLQNESKIQLIVGRVPTAGPRALEELLFEIPNAPKFPVPVIVDAVLGLPQALSHPGPRQLAKEAAKYVPPGGGKPIGRIAAESFFLNIGGSETTMQLPPPRAVETLTGSQSVFKNRPYQKNVQTGTYRILRDLGSEDISRIAFWPFEDTTHARFVYCEGWPTLMWKQLLKVSVRSPEILAQRFQLPRLQEDADLADAAMLAVGGLELHEQNLLLQEPPEPFRSLALTEGWIAGANTLVQSTVLKP